MRNHNEKARDMARSVLPSTARKSARQARASIHGRERARLRAELHSFRLAGDADEFEGDLTWTARRDITEMVDDRRGADKIGPLLAWADRIVERHPALGAATLEDREVYFRKILPPGLIGNHAISHLRFLAGAHDVDAFVNDATWDVLQLVRAFHTETVARSSTSS